MSKPSKKRRTITLSFNAKEAFNQLRINHDTGLVEPLMNGQLVEGGIIGATTSVSYSRKKGPKVITAIQQGARGARMSPYSFLEDYDVIFAVDTNTRKIDQDSISVAAMAILEVRNLERGPTGNLKKADLNMNMFGALIRGKNILGNPEPWFWRIAIEDGIKKLYPKYSSSLRIGLVVDSDLDNLNQYNLRKAPIHDDYFLPPNFTLLYASADTGSDFVLNKLLKLCDREAQIQLELMAASTTSDNVHTQLSGHQNIKVPGSPFRFYEK